jgi:hypothetical protein
MTRHFRHALTAWIACLAILFGALAPAVSHAFVHAAPQPADFPVCSAHGNASGDVKMAGAPDLGADSSRHCPCCFNHHQAPGLLPQTPAALVAIGGPDLPSLFYHASEPLFHWDAPQSRAPPVAS